MVTKIINDGEAKMQSVVNALRSSLVQIRTGRANPSILDRIVIDYYNTPTPLSQMANISAPDARMLMIQPWDRTALKDIEKAILASDLGLTPNNDGTLIRITIPALTEERRKQLVKLVKKESEDHKVGIRNVRRDLNDTVKKMEKDKEIAEDESRRIQDDIQKLTDQYIVELDQVAENKEKEILEI